MDDARFYAALACSHYSRVERYALVLLKCGAAFQTSDFVPRLWNRLAKARRFVRKMEKDGHLSRDGSRLYVIESSFAPPDVSPQAHNPQLFRPEELPEGPLLGAALADRVGEGVTMASPSSPCPVQDGTAGPSTDGRLVLSGTGQALPPAGTGTSPPSQPGPDRSSNRSSTNSIDLDDRSRPNSDGVLVPRGDGRFDVRPADNPANDYHREAVWERLNKDLRLASVKAELVRRKCPTANGFWILFEKKPYEAARILAYIATRKHPPSSLNTCIINALEKLDLQTRKKVGP